MGGADVVITDEMPENMVYVPGTSRYYLHGSDNSTIGHWPTLTAEPVCEGSTAVFTVKTDVEGVKADINYYVELQYQTAVHSSALGNTASAVQFTNKAYAQAGTQTFPAGFKTVEGTNEIMKKSAEQMPNSSYIKYTILVNKSAVDLVPGSDTLALVDTMDPKCTYLPATFHVYYQGTTTEVPNCLTLTENVTLASGARATRLTVTIPDSCAVDVVYQVQPAGNPGDQVNLTNSAELTGVANSATSHEKMWTVVKAGATTEGSGHGITITKFDAANAKKALEGATFELYQVAWDGTETLVDTQTSNANGVVQFGSADKPLLACTLYYFVETQAPAGYQRSTDRTYFMFKGTYSQEKYQEALDKGKALGIAEPSPATSFNITNKKNNTLVVTGEFQLAVSKTVNGAAPKAGETFEFCATSADEGAPALANVTTGEDGSAAFAVAKLSDKDMGKTYTYTIHEVTELTEGAGTWTKAADVTATVAVSERGDDNTLAATVSYSDGSATAAKFDNAYEAQKATATVKVGKTVNGVKNAEEHEKFTFTLLDKNNEQVGDEITVNGTSTAEFGELTFDAPGTYEYTVHETTDLGDGWFNAGDVKVTVSVDYAENGRDLVAKVTYDGSSIDAAQFDNVHAAPATADLKVTKTVNGGALQPHEQFTFTLLDKDGKQLGDEITIKGSDDKPKAVFGQLAFDKVGTYEFTIHETSDLGDGWTNDGDVNVTVTVVRDEATKTLKAEVSYDRSDIDGDAAKFDDKHVAGGSAAIAVVKQVNGAAPAADQKFDFALSANDEASAAKMPTQTATTTVGSAAASFGSVDFTLADAGKTFSYTIHETTPAGESWTNAPDVTVTLTVGDDNDGDGRLPVTAEYSCATADGSAALFDNTHKPVVPEKPSVPKTGDESPVEAMALTAAAGATLAATGLFLGLRSRKRNERL